MHRASIVLTSSVIVLLLASCTDFDCPPNSIDKDNRCIPIKPDGDTSDGAVTDGTIADADTRDRETPDGDDGIDDGGEDARIADTGMDASSCPASCIWGCASGSCDDPKQITAGESHTCALRDSGQVVCWGLNSDGQLGDGTKIDSATPKVVQDLNDAVQVDAGSVHTCAVRASGAVVCWGNNANGRLGDGTFITRVTPVPVRGVTNAREIESIRWGANIRDADGNVRYWGGPGIMQSAVVLRDIAPLADVVSIGGGSTHTCAATESGRGYCWGSRSSGQLGNAGSDGDYFTAFEVGGLSDAIQITAGDRFSCALKEDATVECWGRGNEGQLGNGGNASLSTPSPVNGLDAVARINAGPSALHVCAVQTSHNIMCWGLNDHGQLGDNTRVTRNEPVAVLGLPSAEEVAAGEFHTCARLSTNEIRCWGDNTYGQLGDGSMDESLAPVRVGVPAGP